MEDTDHDTQENPLDRKSKVEYNNFMLELNSNGYINREELAQQFRLDVESYTNKDGLFVAQGDKILRKPHSVSLSSRKINEQIRDFPIGFSKIFYAEGASSVSYTNPPESIPSGCWCTVDLCGGIGPEGHANTCSYPNPLSLNLTLKGFVECIYSVDKTYRSRLRENDSNEIKEAVEYFSNLVEEMSEEFGGEPTNEIFIKAAIKTNKDVKFKFLQKIPKDTVTDPSKVFTSIKYQVVRNIPGLKKGRINYFHGATLIQYCSKLDGIPKRSSIRVYSDAKMTIIPCNWDEKKSYEDMISKIYERINETNIEITPKDAIISVADGSFRLIPKEFDKGINLETFYKVFHPVDEYGNVLQHNDYMSTRTFVVEGGQEHVRRFVTEGNNRYAYKIEEGGRGKLTMKFWKYEDNESTSYKVTTQIYNTGIVQLKFAYKDDQSKEVEKQVLQALGSSKSGIFAQIEYQTKTIRTYFELIRKFLVTVIDKMFANKLDIFEEKEISKTSDKIFNVVPGVMPFGKKKYMYAGYIVDFFDDTREEWDDNYGWSVDDSERGIIIAVEKSKGDKTKYRVITGEPRLEKIIETPALSKIKFKTALNAPIVELEDGDQAYLVENFVKGKAKHWVISGEEDEYNINDLRIHKQSINDTKVYTKDTQVCDKTNEGIVIRPNPYSFYGKCPGGLSQYIDRIGVQSRKDNKFYPTCTKVTDGKSNQTSRNRKEVENEVVDFILNGLDEEQLEEANINPDVEVYMHGVSIKDKYAGTFKPGTIDIGNTITFWDDILQGWSDATLIEYNKSHGLGNDLNHTSFILQRDADITTCQCVIEKKGKQSKRDTSQCSLHIEVRGEQFHPKHRESRNFAGLNNLFPDEEERKEFLISCAKKLNLVKPDIQIQKADVSVQNSVLKKLGQVIGIEKGSFVSVVTGVDPFIEKNIINLTKQAYEAVLIPDDAIRCLLFIVDNENEQYLIDPYDKVRRVNINFNVELENTIIDGYITEKNDFYPFDLLVYNGSKVNEDYLVDDQFADTSGRLIQLQNLVNFSEVLKTPGAIVLKKPLGNYGKKSILKGGKIQIQPFIGPIEPSETLIQFVKKYKKPTNDILFVPQKGSSRYIIWKHYAPNNPIVVQLLKQAETKDSWYIGLIEKTADGISKQWKLLKIPIFLPKSKNDQGREIEFKKNDFVKLRLNIMSNGIINENNPYINPTKVSKEEAKTFEETKIDINLITRSIKEDVFQNAEKWEFSKIMKVFIPDESSRMPLKEKVYKFASQIV
jgi:hypothetical protein